MKYILLMLMIALTISCNEIKDTKEISISYAGFYTNDITLHIKRDFDSLNRVKYTYFEDSLYNPELYLTQKELNKLSSCLLSSYIKPSENLKRKDTGYMILIDQNAEPDTLLFYELDKFNATRKAVEELQPGNGTIRTISDYLNSIGDINFRY